MVARGPGAVGCAHCRKLGAERPCPVCKHLVCESCEADWATCDLPSGRMVRLGRTARLVDVEPSGRHGLVRRWRGPLCVVDLRALKWTDLEVENPVMFGAGGVTPRLTTSGTVIQPVYFTVQQGDQLFSGMRIRALGGTAELTLKDVAPPARITAVTSSGDRYWYVTDTELVTVLIPPSREAPALPAEAAPIAISHPDAIPPPAIAVYEPLPRKVLQAVYYDATRELLVSASWGEIIVHEIEHGKLIQTAYLKTSGNVHWVGLGGPYLAAHVAGGDQRGVTVWKLDEMFAVKSVVLRIEDKVERVALSNDGRYLAVAMENDDVIVHNVDTRDEQRFEDHTDDVSFLGFAGDDQVLISADDDNRVILRPRAATGYATAILGVDLEGA